MQRIATAVFSALIIAGTPVQAADKKGSADHPLISRFKGAEITEYQLSDFDESNMPQKRFDEESDEAPDAVLKLEGKVTRIGYVVKGNKSPLEVQRSYEQALAGAGFKILLSCRDDHSGCGSKGYGSYIVNSGKVITDSSGYDVNFGSQNRYLLARRTNAAGDVAVLIYVMADDDMTDIYQQVVEVKPIEGGQVQVLDAAKLKKSLDLDGHVALYGVHFDTGKAEIKPESKATLDQMGLLLKSSPSLKLYVVGHTDNLGALTANLELSQRRAEAVGAALISGYGVDAKRLAAKGLASFSPIASNTAESGRAQNRRVELVVQ